MKQGYFPILAFLAVMLFSATGSALVYPPCATECPAGTNCSILFMGSDLNINCDEYATGLYCGGEGCFSGDTCDIVAGMLCDTPCADETILTCAVTTCGESAIGEARGCTDLSGYNVPVGVAYDTCNPTFDALCTAQDYRWQNCSCNGTSGCTCVTDVNGPDGLPATGRRDRHGLELRRRGQLQHRLLHK